MIGVNSGVHRVVVGLDSFEEMLVEEASTQSLGTQHGTRIYESRLYKVTGYNSGTAPGPAAGAYQGLVPVR